MSNENKEQFRKAEGKLYNFTRTKAEVEFLKLEIEEIENDYRGCGAITYDEKTSQTYSISSSVESELVKKEKMLEKKNKEKNKKDIVVKKIKNALTILTDEEKEVVEKRYFSNKTLPWNKIGETLNLSEVRCKQMRVEIIDKIKDLL